MVRRHEGHLLTRALLVLIVATFSAFAETVHITIQYSDGRPDKIVETPYTPGASALAVLKQVSRVETSQTGDYTFVRSIDGVRSEPGKFGWFYEIDGKSVPKTADAFPLHNARTMHWVYKVEACY